MFKQMLRAAAAACCGGIPLAPVAAASLATAQAPAIFATRVVALHNDVRWAAGVAPIRWDPGLAAAAAAYADELARTGRWGHSPARQRPGQGENLWMGTHGAFGLNQMLASWASERSLARSGVFPRVSKTGRWDDVGHYTQMVWPGSTRVGCAVRSTGNYDYLVCRYWPAGNVMGARVP